MKTVLENEMSAHPNRERDDESATDRKGEVEEGEQVRALWKCLELQFIRNSHLGSCQLQGGGDSEGGSESAQAAFNSDEGKVVNSHKSNK